ncbi:MAG: hypothetical protein Q8M24_12010 [Pseudolabrys sp.]|nr:hypothetical protein [Pseudolabrys sp.]MDP2296171.1 hypothetical protein [Pseudolabrys sp.]
MAGSDQYATHLFSYRFDGHQYTVDIVAKDANEAKERLKALNWAKHDGVLVARIPAGLGLLARLSVAVRNATRAICP